jgi:hypothetical protein
LESHAAPFKHGNEDGTSTWHFFIVEHEARAFNTVVPNLWQKSQKRRTGQEYFQVRFHVFHDRHANLTRKLGRSVGKTGVSWDIAEGLKLT